MPARSPRFSPNESTSAPCARATAAVPSVEPSSTTSTSASGSTARSSSSTADRFVSSFQAGMKTSVPATSGGVEPLLRRLEPLGDDRLGRVGGARDDRVGLVLGLEVREDVVGERAGVAPPRPPHPDSQAQELLRPERLRDRAQPVVPGESAPEPRLEPPQVEVALVVDDEQLLRRQLEEAEGGADGAPRLVHVGHRLEQRDARLADPQLAQIAGELAAPGAAVAPRQLVHDHVADVVPVAGVLAARVPEARDEQVERRGGVASPEQSHALTRRGAGLALLAGAGLGARLRRRLLRGAPPGPPPPRGPPPPPPPPPL